MFFLRKEKNSTFVEMTEVNIIFFLIKKTPTDFKNLSEF
jgi:hypothetical protein